MKKFMDWIIPMLQFRKNVKLIRFTLALSLGAAFIATLTLSLDSSNAEIVDRKTDQASTSRVIPIPENPTTPLESQKVVDAQPQKLTLRLPTPSNSPTPRLSETPLPETTLTFPDDIPTKVIERLLEFPRIQELTDVSNIVVINGEYCVAGELRVICYNEEQDAFNLWDDFDPAQYFDPAWVSPTPAP